jgi:hypothetical protein
MSQMAKDIYIFSCTFIESDVSVGCVRFQWDQRFAGKSEERPKLTCKANVKELLLKKYDWSAWSGFILLRVKTFGELI